MYPYFPCFDVSSQSGYLIQHNYSLGEEERFLVALHSYQTSEGVHTEAFT